MNVIELEFIILVISENLYDTKSATSDLLWTKHSSSDSDGVSRLEEHLQN